MYLLVFLFLAIVLAIPTFGISLLVFFYVKNWCDKTAAKAILNACVSSLREGVVIDLFHVNRGAIKKVFEWLSVEGYARADSENLKRSVYEGYIDHPIIGRVYLVVYYRVRKGTKNTISVLASST